MNAIGPSGTEPSHVLPAAFSEAVDLVRPVLTAGTQPGAVVILLTIEAQGAEEG